MAKCVPHMIDGQADASSNHERPAVAGAPAQSVGGIGTGNQGRKVMTLAEFFAQMRAMMTNAEAEAPEVPPTPDPPAPTPPPVAPLPEAGQQAIVDAVLAALAAQQQTNPPPIGTATRTGPTARAAGFRPGSRLGHPPTRRPTPRACCSG